MKSSSTKTTYGETGFYSRIILDYLEGKEQLKPFFSHPGSIAGIKAAIDDRKKYPTNRNMLVNTLEKHYAAEKPSARQSANLKLLSNINCFTVTTAHQPNIFTGHLYFVYKILHAIKLTEQLKKEMPDNDFVPVFYMGSEDADLEELGQVYANGVKHVWETKQTGAVGRMKVDKALLKILDDISGEVSVQPFGQEIIDKMKACYTEGSTVEESTFRLINEMFGDYGLLVLLPDDADYKRAFVPVAEKELKEQFSFSIVEDTVAGFPREYKVQAGGRDLNMFYLKDDIRERIEKRNNQYSIINTQYSFTEEEIITELKTYPERFSPNVILRPVFQEMILPNIAFIGGGGEIAYWLELKNVFGAVNVPFPVLVLRNSFMIVDKKQAEKIKKLGFTVSDMFKAERDLMSELVKRESAVQLKLDKEKNILQDFYSQLKITSGKIDVTLQPHTEALEKQALRKIEALEKKMLRAEKKKFEAQQRQLHKLKAQLFPNNNLQERVENIIPLYAKYGNDFIKALYGYSQGLEQEFVIMEIE